MYAETLLDIAMTHADNLILKAAKGDIGAFNQLVNLWYKRIYNYALKYFCDHDMAMEISQKTFITVNLKLETLREPSKFKPWIYRVASNLCHEEERRRKRTHLKVTFDTESDEVQNVEGTEYNPDRTFQQNELAEILLDALSLINEEQREIVIMKEYEGLKFIEIAEILEISENTAKSRLYYGISALRKILVKKNVTKDTVYYG
ncbi:MAG TPA: RNA polymerase sigma factor [Cyclobacteriaceae bacterium]|jgi:RNA polymerase sigma-70 factor (ECF subfamily)